MWLFSGGQACVKRFYMLEMMVAVMADVGGFKASQFSSLLLPNKQMDGGF